MNKIAEHCERTGTVWKIAVSGDPIGMTFWHKDANSPDALPTEESVRRVAKAFGAWIAKRFPKKSTPQSQYFVAFYDGAAKVFPSRKGEADRRKNGNHFQSQTEAQTASMALKWLIDGERKRFESAA